MTNSVEHVKKFNIICDTNIIIDLTKEHFRPKLLNFLISLEKNKNNFYYSNYSIFELFRGVPKKLIDEYGKLLRVFHKMDVNDNIFTLAAQLMSLYRHQKIVANGNVSRKDPNTIDDGDYIISASAFWYKNTAILTRNYSDFPRPFFNEFHKYFLEYKIKGNKGCEVYYLLIPDLPYANLVYGYIN